MTKSYAVYTVVDALMFFVAFQLSLSSVFSDWWVGDGDASALGVTTTRFEIGVWTMSLMVLREGDDVVLGEVPSYAADWTWDQARDASVASSESRTRPQACNLVMGLQILSVLPPVFSFLASLFMSISLCTSPLVMVLGVISATLSALSALFGVMLAVLIQTTGLGSSGFLLYAVSAFLIWMATALAVQAASKAMPPAQDPPKKKVARMERAEKANQAASQDLARQDAGKEQVQTARETARTKRSHPSDTSDDVGGFERLPPKHLQAVLFWNQNKDPDDVSAQQNVPTEMLEMAFQEIDEDSSGFIVVEELVEALHMCGLKANPAAVTRIITDMDKNNDGDIDIVEFCEFFRQLEELSQFHHKAKARKQFCSILCNCCFFLNLSFVFVLILLFVDMEESDDPDLYSIVSTFLIAMIAGLAVLFTCVIGMPATKLSIGKHVAGWAHYYDQRQLASATLKPVQAAAPKELAEDSDDPEHLRAVAFKAVREHQLALPGVPPTVAFGTIEDQECQPPGVIADAGGNFIRYDPSAYSRAAVRAIEARPPKSFNPLHASQIVELPGDPAMSRAPKALTGGGGNWKSSPWAEPIEDKPRGPARFGQAAPGVSVSPALGNGGGGASQGLAALPAPSDVLQVDLDEDWESRYKTSEGRGSQEGARDSYQTNESEVFQA